MIIDNLPGSVCIIDDNGVIYNKNTDFSLRFKEVNNFFTLLSENDIDRVKQNKTSNGVINANYIFSTSKTKKNYNIVFIIDNPFKKDSLVLSRLLPVSKSSKYHESVTIMFIDIVGFTSASSLQHPCNVMKFIQNLFQRFDELCLRYGVFRYETVGDCYVICTGLVNTYRDGTIDYLIDGENSDHANQSVRFAIKLAKEASKIRMLGNTGGVSLRIGGHTGPIASGIISKTFPKLCLFGDTINTASRMESTCHPSNMHITESVYNLLDSDLKEQFEQRKSVFLKGKGVYNTWTLNLDEN